MSDNNEPKLDGQEPRKESNVTDMDSRFNQTFSNVQGLLKGRSIPGKVVLRQRSDYPEEEKGIKELSINYKRSLSSNDACTSDQMVAAAEEELQSSGKQKAQVLSKSRTMPKTLDNPSKDFQQPFKGARAMDSARVMKFEKVLSGTTIIIEKLRELAWSGVPDYMRPMVWRLLLGYATPNSDRRKGMLRRKRLEYLESASQCYDIPDTDCSEDEINMRRQIAVDCPRTVPDVSFFQQAQVQKSLERILYTWAIRHPASGYVQGINDLVTPFLVVFLSEYLEGDIDEWSVSDISPEEIANVEADCYWCLSKLLDGMQDHYTFAQPGIQRLVYKLKELVRRIDGPNIGIRAFDLAMGENTEFSKALGRLESSVSELKGSWQNLMENMNLLLDRVQSKFPVESKWVIGSTSLAPTLENAQIEDEKESENQLAQQEPTKKTKMEGSNIKDHLARERNKAQSDLNKMKTGWADTCYALKLSYRMVHTIALDRAGQKDDRTRLPWTELFKNTHRTAAYAWKQCVKLQLSEENASALTFLVGEPALTCSFTLKVCARAMAFSEAIQVHPLIVCHGFQVVALVWTILSTGYTEVREPDSAKKVFGEMDLRDTVFSKELMFWVDSLGQPPGPFQEIVSANPSFTSYEFGSYVVNQSFPFLTMPTLLENVAPASIMTFPRINSGILRGDWISEATGAVVYNFCRINQLTGSSPQAPFVDSMNLQYLKSSGYNAVQLAVLHVPSVNSNYLGHSHMGLLDFQKAYLGVLLSPQTSQYSVSLGGKYVGSNNHGYFGNPGYGVGVSYAGSPIPYSIISNFPVESGSHIWRGDLIMCLSSDMRKLDGGMVRPWNLEVGLKENLVSSLLEEFTSNTTKCLKLVEIGGQIELSADQYGNRILQQKLDIATVEKNLVYQETVPHTLSLQTYEFENYRTLAEGNIASYLEDSGIQVLCEQFGDVYKTQILVACIHPGLLTGVSIYNRYSSQNPPKPVNPHGMVFGTNSSGNGGDGKNDHQQWVDVNESKVPGIPKGDEQGMTAREAKYKSEKINENRESSSPLKAQPAGSEVSHKEFADLYFNGCRIILPKGIIRRHSIVVTAMWNSNDCSLTIEVVTEPEGDVGMIDCVQTYFFLVHVKLANQLGTEPISHTRSLTHFHKDITTTKTVVSIVQLVGMEILNLQVSIKALKKTSNSWSKAVADVRDMLQSTSDSTVGIALHGSFPHEQSDVISTIQVTETGAIADLSHMKRFHHCDEDFVLMLAALFNITQFQEMQALGESVSALEVLSRAVVIGNRDLTLIQVSTTIDSGPPMGVLELEKFAAGTETMVKKLKDDTGKSVPTTMDDNIHFVAHGQQHRYEVNPLVGKEETGRHMERVDLLGHSSLIGVLFCIQFKFSFGTTSALLLGFAPAEVLGLDILISTPTINLEDKVVLLPAGNVMTHVRRCHDPSEEGHLSNLTNTRQILLSVV